MPILSEPSHKPKHPGFAAYPTGYELLKERLEPFLPLEEFSWSYCGIDQRFAKQPDFTPLKIFGIEYTPAKWREAHWTLRADPAPRIDKPLIRDAMIATGFSLLVDFLQTKRTPIWRDLAFSRSLHGDSKTKTLTFEDRNQLEKKI